MENITARKSAGSVGPAGENHQPMAAKPPSVQKSTRTVSVGEARKILQSAWELRQRHRTLESWRVMVAPDVAAAAVKAYGSLDAAHNASVVEVLQCVIAAHDQWHAAAARSGRARVSAAKEFHRGGR